MRAEMLSMLLSVFAVIVVADLPDKTALASLVLATRREPAPVWPGSSARAGMRSSVTTQLRARAGTPRGPSSPPR